MSINTLKNAKKVEEGVERLLADNNRLRSVLKRYAHDFCEGWCQDNGGNFDDCSGCPARLALEE